MSVLTWTYLLVGASFALYIGIAIWSRAAHTRDFYVAGGAWYRNTGRPRTEVFEPGEPSQRSGRSRYVAESQT